MSATVSVSNNPGHNGRIDAGTKRFASIFNSECATVSRAPGRAEILGCHTDYNYGYALACGIGKYTYAFASKRTDRTISIASTAFPGVPVSFSLDTISRSDEYTWTNYARAVCKELLTNNYPIGGANILIESDVPKSGGVSSSAALELAIAFALLRLYEQPLDPMKTALLCKIAENSPIVKSPCGFLDQGASAFAKDQSLVFLDFLPDGDSPVSEVKSIPAEFPKPVTFVIPVDPTLERQLGETGYVVRRKMCEESIPFWSEKLGRNIQSLRDVSISEFETNRDELESNNPEMRKRVEHIVRENQRVLDAVKALQTKDLQAFGSLLTEGGKSSLELYELDENTPQLTLIVEQGRTIPGVIGMRNMGGGFSAIGLALVEDAALDAFQAQLSERYNTAFGRNLEYITFTPSAGAEIIYA